MMDFDEIDKLGPVEFGAAVAKSRCVECSVSGAEQGRPDWMERIRDCSLESCAVWRIRPYQVDADQAALRRGALT
jgi:hypothetical protein